MTDSEIKLVQMNIFGSCVTRDMLEYGIKRRIRVGEYVARQSIISLLASPVYTEEEIHLISNFQIRQLRSDLQKDAMQRFRDNIGNYLIIDLVEERFPVGKVGKAYITLSNEFRQSELLKNQKIKVYEKKLKHDKVYFRHKDMKIYLDQFMDLLLNIYSQEKIIVHEVYFSNYYFDKIGTKREFPLNYIVYNKKMNGIYRYMYQYIKEKLPNAHVISISEKYIADENHKWGLAPMHFQKEYYEEAVNILEGFLNTDKNE